MSSPNPSDPRLLLPDWLRDGDASLPTPGEAKPTEPVVAVVEATEVMVEAPASPQDTLVDPYSDRLALDTRLDPQQLVSPADLPTWLGGLDHAPAVPGGAALARPRIAPSTSEARPAAPVPITPIEEPEPYEGVDAPEDGVIDIEVNGWYMLAGALGLLVLLAAALRLYLS